MCDRPVISWDRAMLRRFVRAIAAAEAADKDVFEFDGHEYLLSYARYLAQYLSTRLRRSTDE
jgi:hypothetical protein